MTSIVILYSPVIAVALFIIKRKAVCRLVGIVNRLPDKHHTSFANRHSPDILKDFAVCDYIVTKDFILTRLVYCDSGTSSPKYNFHRKHFHIIRIHHSSRFSSDEETINFSFDYNTEFHILAHIYNVAV